MAASTLTPEAVQDALRDVLERGEYPSMAKVRAELDTTASQQTLTGHMRAALKGLATQMGTGLPEGLPRSVVDAAHRFYGEARDSAREELEKQRALMAEQQQRLTDELAEANQKASALEQQVGQLQQRAEGAEREGASLKQQFDESQQKLHDSQGSNAHLTDELRNTRSQTARHIRQLRASQRKQVDSLTHERDEMAAARDREIERGDEQQKAWAVQIDQARQETRAAQAEHEKQIKALSSERDQAITQRDENARSVRDRERTIARLNADLKESQQRVTATDESARQAAEQARSVSERMDTMQSEQNALREKLASVTAVAEERGRLIDRLARADDVNNSDAGSESKK